MRQEITVVYAETDKTITIIRVDGLSRDIPDSVRPNARHNLSSFEVAMKLAGWRKLARQRTSDMHHVVTYERE